MSRRPRLAVACVLLAIVAGALPVATATANPFPVTNTADAGAGSLRDAIGSANLHAGLDSIPISATGTINLESALPTITEAVDITGPGQSALTVRRNVAAPFRILTVGEAAVSISGMTITNGQSEFGGGILSNGALTLTGVTVSRNEALADGGMGPIAEGGGILSEGPALTMRETTVTENSANSANGEDATQSLFGGVGARGTAVISRSTVSGNVARAASNMGRTVALAAGIGLGGATTIDQSTISDNSDLTFGVAPSVSTAGGIDSESELTITGSTITGNLVAAGTTGGANLKVAPTSVVRDTIVSNPQGAPSCEIGVTSAGFNIDDGVSCGFSQPTDRSNTNPGLDPNLAQNGGPTLTHALLPGSVAIDRGSAFGATTDQRGFSRPSDFLTVPNVAGDSSDIGAFELQAPAVVPPPPDRIAPDTRIDHGPAHRTTRRQAKFRFSSSEGGFRFECKVDKGRFRSCASPFQRTVSAGKKHVFLVRAIDAAGNIDPTPAKYSWRVKRLSRAPHRAR